MIRTLLIRSLAAILVLAAALYAYDFISVHWRMREHKQNDPLETLTFPHVLAIPQKGRRVEYALDAQNPFITVECVHSIFPELGHDPCWYVKSENESPVPLVIMPVLRLPL